MNKSLRLLLSFSLIVSCALQAMEEKKSVLPIMEDKPALPFASTDSKDAPTYSVVRDESFELEMKHYKNLAKIQALARTLEASLNSDEEYYEISVRKYRNAQDLKELAAQQDLIKPTRHAIKAIIKLAAIDDIDPTILENVISSIPPFKIKYVAASTENLPKTAKAKKLETTAHQTVGYTVKDNTENFKNEMLCAFLGCNPPFHALTDTHQP